MTDQAHELAKEPFEFWRFADLQRRKIVTSRVTLSRWQRQLGFPRPIKIGPNTAAFRVSEIEAWLRERVRVQTQ